MGARTIRSRDDSAVRKKVTITFWAIMAAIGLPMILAVALVSLDMRAELSELKPNATTDSKGAMVVGWADLREPREPSARARVLGYMFDDLRRPHEGSRADIFILLPEAGQLLHPAHRIPNQMIVVWPSYPVVFRNRQLVWAAGTLSRTPRGLVAIIRAAELSRSGCKATSKPQDHHTITPLA